MREDRVIVDHLQPGVVGAPVVQQFQGLGETGLKAASTVP